MQVFIPRKQDLCGWCVLTLVLALLAGTAAPVAAQDFPGAGPVYVVQTGDSLWDIAQKFGISLDELIRANQLADPNQLFAGMELVIPGLEGIQGRLITQPVGYGEDFRSLSRRYDLSSESLARLNHLVSPAELYAGYSLVLPESEEARHAFQRAALAPGGTLLELAVLEGSNPWSLVLTNRLPGQWAVLPGDTLQVPAAQATNGPQGLPSEIIGIEIDPLPLRQGKVGVISVEAQTGLELRGVFINHQFEFYESEPGLYYALLGVHAMLAPGLYPLELQGELPTGAPVNFEQNVLVQVVDYPYDRPLTVDPTTVDPAVTRPEDAQWTALAQPQTPDRIWKGKFVIPSPLPEDYCLETGECWSSRFGNRRSYNGGPYNAFHTGLDIVGTTGTEIFAPADGIVVFAGPLTVRGKATMIDHGWGIYSAYLHQSEILVQVGDRVATGQLIGRVGNTGRVEGPHLHWEIWAGGVQVDPIDWLTTTYP